MARLEPAAGQGEGSAFPRPVRLPSRARRPPTERAWPSLARERVSTEAGGATTVHVATFTRSTGLRVVRFARPERLALWCASRGVRHALVGGFFTRPGGVPLGDLRTAGIRRRSVPFDAPWDAVRACIHVAGGDVRLAQRDALEPEPRGDLLQAGPLLVSGGRSVIVPGEDPEGFGAGARQFDSDITAGRYPRAALGVADGRLLAVAVDGRGVLDAGLTLTELADLLVELGAESAINLDGGGSTSLVCGGRLRNRPRADHEIDLPLGRPIASALVFDPR